MPDITGSCRCGQATYSAHAEPMFVGVCHCRDCQKSSGSAFAVVVAVPAAALTVSGATTTFDATSDSGHATHRRFCPDCGSPLMIEAEVMPGAVMLAAGTLEDPSWVKPSMQIFCDSAQPWVSLGGEIKSFAKMPG